MNIGTPSNIEVLMHCHTSGLPHPRANAPSVKEAIAILLDKRCIEPTHSRDHIDGVYKTTAKGQAWVKMLCDTPMPVATYKDPRF